MRYISDLSNNTVMRYISDLNIHISHILRSTVRRARLQSYMYLEVIIV